MPTPAYDIFDIPTDLDFLQLDSYDARLKGLSVIASRGCPFQCTYCQPTLQHLFGRKLCIRSPRRLMDDIKVFIERFQVRVFYFMDDTLTVFKDWMHEFCDILIEEKLGITWACNTRVDTWDEDFLRRMHEGGLVKMKVGIESASNRIRNRIYRKTSRWRIFKNFLMLRKKWLSRWSDS